MCDFFSQVIVTTPVVSVGNSLSN